MTLDAFMQFGSEPLGLLLFWGDVAGMRAGLAKAVDAHAQVAARVRRGEATADTCAHPSSLPMCGAARCVVGPDY